jgi:hypothetical protein
MGLRREDVYIANIIKCRPPGNRTPERDECETCSPFLMRQIAAINRRRSWRWARLQRKRFWQSMRPCPSFGDAGSISRHQAGRNLSSRVSAARSASEERDLERLADGDEGTGNGDTGEGRRVDLILPVLKDASRLASIFSWDVWKDCDVEDIVRGHGDITDRVILVVLRFRPPAHESSTLEEDCVLARLQLLSE